MCICVYIRHYMYVQTHAHIRCYIAPRCVTLRYARNVMQRSKTNQIITIAIITIAIITIAIITIAIVQ